MFNVYTNEIKKWLGDGIMCHVSLILKVSMLASYDDRDCWFRLLSGPASDHRTQA